MKPIHQYIGKLPNELDNQQGNYAASYFQYLAYGSDTRFKPDYEMYYISRRKSIEIERKVAELFRNEVG